MCGARALRLPRACRACGPDAAPRSQCSVPPAGSDTYAVRRHTPPQEDLGWTVLHGNVQNGDALDLHGKAWVVSRVSTRFKLERGRYRKDGVRLYVTETSRWLLDGFLEGLYKQ